MSKIENKVEYVNIDLLKKNPKNPRNIKPRKLSKLIESIKNDPKFLELRPILVDENYEIYAGNQRYQACVILNYKEVPIIMTKGISKELKEERMLKDNLHSGEFDFEKLKDEFDNEQVKYIFDDEEVFENLKEKVKEDETDKQLIKDMELKNFESYDYLVFCFNDVRDFLYALNKFGIGKVNCSYSEKKQKIGIGRVIDGKELVKII